jgi:hypothetical protein
LPDHVQKQIQIDKTSTKSVLTLSAREYIWNLKSTMPGHFTTLWESQNNSTPSGQLATRGCLVLVPSSALKC